jgi:3,4-dihydroxy 2-butanone 4-phosphate synthase/GTP cyclohydrolase II
MNPDDPISPIEDIIEDARQGRPYILVDAEDRENEGDVIIPAQMATPEQINFMAKHARGLICLAITPSARQGAAPFADGHENQAEHGTAFTVSIEAKEGVTTGISAHDRARTVAVAIDPTKDRRRSSSARATYFRWWPRRAACWCARAIPRPRWTSRVWPAYFPRA